MKLWLISQSQEKGYDTYDSAVVVAMDASSAMAIHPDMDGKGPTDGTGSLVGWNSCTWAHHPTKVRAEYIGEAREGMPTGVVCASFNAG